MKKLKGLNFNYPFKGIASNSSNHEMFQENGKSLMWRKVCVCVCVIQTNGVYSPESVAMFSLLSGNPTSIYIMEKW